MSEQIRARRLLTEYGWGNHYVLEHERGIITDIRPQLPGDTEYDVDILVPALIDGHVHGGYGVDVMDPEPDVFTRLSLGKASEGVGAFVATTITATPPEIEQALTRIAAATTSQLPGAQVLGSYMEGPYFTPTHAGAQDPALFRELDLDEIEQFCLHAGGSLKVVALAPEKPSSLAIIQFLQQRGIRVMLGHSNADYVIATAALDAGASGIVHCFNGMTGLHHRAPGMAGAGLMHPQAWVELIADGQHVHPAMLKLCYLCATDRLILITDAMRASGLADGHYRLGPFDVEKNGNTVRTQQGSLAGSALSLLQAVRNMVQLAEVPLGIAIHLAALSPARWLGVDDRLGSLRIGKRANMLALDDSLHQQHIWVGGELIDPCLFPLPIPCH